MKIEKNKVVTFHYRLSEAGGELIDDSHGHPPAVYLHGHEGILKSLEEVLAGKQPGDKIVETFSPEQAYGPRRAEAQMRISLKHVRVPAGHKGKLTPGMVVGLETEQGLREVTVVKTGLKTVDVDTNHPLAGKTLTFEIEVVDVRDATAEEIEHGHVHGEGGHHH